MKGPEKSSLSLPPLPKNFSRPGKYNRVLKGPRVKTESQHDPQSEEKVKKSSSHKILPKTYLPCMHNQNCIKLGRVPKKQEMDHRYYSKLCEAKVKDQIKPTLIKQEEQKLSYSLLETQNPEENQKQKQFFDKVFKMRDMVHSMKRQANKLNHKFIQVNLETSRKIQQLKKKDQ